MRAAPSSARQGFSLIEVLLVIGLLGVTSNFTIPMYRRYQVLSDLNLTTQQTLQMIGRARILAQAAEGDSDWGVYVPAGILYKGASIATRDPAFDEVYPVPQTIGFSGRQDFSSVQDVSFAKLSGRPSGSGHIMLTSLFGEVRVVTIQLEADGRTIVPSDLLTICHRTGQGGNTMHVTEVQWTAHQNHGDTLGACASSSSSSMSGGSSTSASSQASNPGSSSAQSSSGAGGAASSSSWGCNQFDYATTFPNLYNATTADIRVDPDRGCTGNATISNLSPPSPTCEARSSRIDCDDMPPTNGNYAISFRANFTGTCSDPFAVFEVDYNGVPKGLPDSQNIVVYAQACGAASSTSSAASTSSSASAGSASSGSASSAAASAGSSGSVGSSASGGGGASSSSSSVSSCGNRLANGSFEEPVIANNSLILAQSIPGWIERTDAGYMVEIQRGISGPAAAGSQYAEVDVTGQTLLEQDVATPEGNAPFRLSFSYAPRPVNSQQQWMAVYWNGVHIGTVTGIPPNGTTAAWNEYTFDVTSGLTGTSRLGFASYGDSEPGESNLLDNVQVLAVSGACGNASSSAGASSCNSSSGGPSSAPNPCDAQI